MNQVSENDVKGLLNEVSITIKNFEDKWLKSGEKYNIFNVANIAHKEVIMCRVLADLLNPKGKHCQGSRYLKLFYETISSKLPEFKLDIENTKVTAEYVINENRRIDITLEDGKIFVPIEVKIWAGDQLKQVKDYYEFAKKKNNVNVPVLYLTIDGHEPSDISKDGIGNDCYVKLSFGDDILTWLEKCTFSNTEETTVPVKENLRQFIAAIKSFCGKSEDEEMEKAIAELIIDSEKSIQAALEINNALQKINNETKELFISNILKIVKEEYHNVREFTEEGWFGICVPKLKDQYDLYIDYDWKTISINRDSNTSNLIIEEKLAIKMSEITHCEKEIWGSDNVWATKNARYPGMENTNITYYNYELYRKYVKDQDEVAKEIIKIARMLNSVKE